MIISISGIDGSGKTSLIQSIAKENNFRIPPHVSEFVKFPENLVEWYTKGNIDEVIKLDLEAFTQRNASVYGYQNVLLDRGYQNIIDSACARYQNRLGISYAEALERVIKINQNIGLAKIEDKLILLDFPFDDWKKILDILNKRVGPLSSHYLGYLKILDQNIKFHLDIYDYVLDAARSIDYNLEQSMVQLDL